MPADDGLQPHWEAVVVPLGFEPRSEEPESSMMDRYTKGLLCWRIAFPSSIQRLFGVLSTVASSIEFECANPLDSCH